HSQSLPIGSLFGSGSDLQDDPIEKAIGMFTGSIPRGVVNRIVVLGPEKGARIAGDRQTILKKLDQILIEELEPYLPSNPDENVVIVPDGSMFLVPFGALPNKYGKYFIDQHTLAITPSLGIYALLQQSKKQLGSPSGQQRAPLVVGNPQMPAFPKDTNV